MENVYQKRLEMFRREQTTVGESLSSSTERVRRLGAREPGPQRGEPEEGADGQPEGYQA